MARCTYSFPTNVNLRSCEFVTVERTIRLPPSLLRDGVPLAPVPRACLDAARRLRSAAHITELIADTVQRQLCTPAHLAAELRQGSQRGSATPRRVLADVADGVRSTAERDAKRLLARSRLPAPWWNVEVRNLQGRLLGIADAWFDEVALAWEINSYAWHLLPQYYANEVKRTAGLTAEGVTVLPVLPTSLRDDGDRSLAELRGHLRRRPDVVPALPSSQSGARERHRSERTRRSVGLTYPTPRSLGFRRLSAQPTDGPRPRDCGVEESGDGCGMPSSSGPNSVISALFQGV